MLEMQMNASYAAAVIAAATIMLPLSPAHAQAHLHTGSDERGTGASCAEDAAPSVHCGTTPTAAFDREGRLWAAFAQGEHVYVARSADGGARFDKAVRVNAVPEALDVNGENRPKIAFGAGGEIYVSWTKKLGGGYNGDIRFSRSLDRGRTFAPPVTVNDDGLLTGHRFESLHVDPAGHVYIAWLDKRDLAAVPQGDADYVGAAVYYTMSTDSGASFATNRRVASHSCECCRIAMTDVTGAQAGGVAIFWRHVFADRARDHAFAVLGPEGLAGRVQRATHDDWQIDACPHHGPAMTPAGDGRYHLAWFTGGAERKGIYYGRYAPRSTSTSTSPRQLKSVAPSAGAGHPSLASSAGRLYLAWKEFDGERTNVNVIVSSDDGHTWGPATAVARSGGASDHPFLLAHAGKTIVTWHTETEGLRIVPVSPQSASTARGELQ